MKTSDHHYCVLSLIHSAPVIRTKIVLFLANKIGGVLFSLKFYISLWANLQLAYQDVGRTFGETQHSENDRNQTRAKYIDELTPLF